MVTQAEWCEILIGTEACFAPVLKPAEAPEHPHNHERATFTEVGGAVQPAPAPRFSRTPAEAGAPAPKRGEHTEEVLARFGFDRGRIDELRGLGVLG